MNSCEWENLPSVVLIHLFQYLSHSDRIKASAVCQHWREAFWFYPSWRKLDLNATSWLIEKNAFLVEKYSKTCLSLRITFVYEDLKNVGAILRDWTVHPGFSEFQMVGSADKEKPSEKGIMESIVYPFIEKCSIIKELVLSHVENPARLTAVLEKNASIIESLGIGSLINGTEDENVTIPADLLSTFVNVTVLQLDCSWITADALSAIAKLPLKRFIATMQEGSTIHSISESSWQSFIRQMRHSEIRITYYKITNAELSDGHKEFFRGTAIISHVRFIYCSHKFQEACLNALLRERLNTHTITTIWAIMDPKEKNNISREHAFVVCAWRFKHLRELILSGASYDKYDLEGMARMRPGLRLHIAKEDIWELNNGHRLLTTLELNTLSKVLKPSKGGVWLPMDEKRFNDPTLSFKDREAMVLRELYCDDFKAKCQK